MLRHAAEDAASRLECSAEDIVGKVARFDVTAIINYGPDGYALGFNRRFRIANRYERPARVFPETITTTRLTGRRERRRMARWLDRMR